MSEHYPRHMIGETVDAWCDACGKATPHRVDAVTTEKKAGKLGPCLNPHSSGLSKSQRARRDKAARDAQQPKLFG